MNKKTDVRSTDEKIESVVKNLFLGHVDGSVVSPFPSFSDDEKEIGKTMADVIARFAADNIDSAKMDHACEIPAEILSSLAEMGLAGINIPEEFGGLGLPYTLYARIFQEIGSVDGSVGVTLGAHQSIGLRAILNEGTPEQKAKWLPKLAAGEKWAAFALTEPGAGSDAHSIKTKAVRNSDGTYTLNGQKLWITNAGMADIYTVFCKIPCEEEGKKTEKITAFIVEKDSVGVSFGEKEKKMGLRASETRAIFFDNVVVPAENMLGGEGNGFKVAMNVLNSGRLSLGAGAVGAMRTVLKLACAHAVERKQFGKSLSEFGIIQDMIAQMAAGLYSSEATVYMTTGLICRGLRDFSLESAICKIYCSETLWQVANTAMQVSGGNGYMEEYPYERIVRDARINTIFEGTNEILRCYLALVGLKAPSEHLKELGKIADISKAMAAPIHALGVATDFARKRIGHVFFSRGVLKVHPDLEKHASEFSLMLNQFAVEVEDVLIRHGKRIIDHELPQMRMANMAVELYVALCTLMRTNSLLGRNDVSAEKKNLCKQLTTIALKKSRHVFTDNCKMMRRHCDRSVREASEILCKNGGYPLEILDG
jgi:acyl-CoA dehydrogenase family protein 9